MSLLLLMAGCMSMAPEYERPAMESPEAWRTPISSADAVESGWWKQFGDGVLDGLIDQALASNQDLQVAIARVDEFKAKLGITESQMYPQITGSGLADRNRISSSITALPPGVKQVFSAFGFLFNGTYYLDLWGQVRSAVNASYHEWLASIEARRVVVLTLVSAVSSTYIELRQFDQQLAIGLATLATREESYRLAKIRYELGLTSEIQVEQAISEVEVAKVEVENLQISIAETENLLSFLVGVPSSSIQRGLSLDQVVMPPSVPTYLPSEIVNQRPDIRAAENRLIAANANIGVARAKFFPQINMNAAIGYGAVQFNQLLDQSSQNWQVGGNALEQIFDGFYLLNNLYVTEAMQREALHNYLSVLLKAFKEVNDALTKHKIDLEIVETQAIRVKADKAYLHLADLRYKEGQTDYLTFLDAERQYFRSLLDYEQAKGDSFLSYVQIYQSLGGDWVTEADKIALADAQSEQDQANDEPDGTGDIIDP